MASPKALILQGILGVAGLCASGAGGIGLGLGKAFKGVQSDAPSATDSADKPEIKPQDTDGKAEEDGDLGIPEECEGSCSLTAEQLKKLKFEARSADSQITFDGLGENNEFELIIEESSDSANYPRGKKYTLRPKTIAGPVTVKNIKEGDIVLEGGKEVVIREVSSGGKLEHLLEEVTELGIPKRCKADEVTAAETKTCELTQHQLQKLNFETRDSERITVEGLNEGNLVTLKIEDKKDDLNNYPKGKKYILTSATGDVTIKGIKEGDITLGDNSPVLIRETEEGGKLEHLLEEVDGLGIPKRCKADEVTSEKTQKCDLIQKQLKDLKFEPKEGSQITVEGQSGNSTFELIIEDKEGDQNYPKGKKYTIRSTGTSATIQNVKEGNIHIWKNQSVVVRETEEGGKLEMAPVEVDELGIPRNCKDSCSLTEQQIKKLQFETKDNEGITVEGIKKAKTITLKVENRKNDTDNYPKGKKYILTSTSGDVTIKGLKDGDITIGGKGVVIREKEDEQKLEIAPEEVDNLGIPSRCIPGLTCKLTKEELKKLKFETRNNEKISVEGLEGNNTVDLKVSGVTGDIDNYPKWKKYTLKSTRGTVTIRNAKDKDIVLEENKAVDFREIKTGNKLETSLDILGIPRGCGAEEIKGSTDTKTCYLSSDQVKDLRFGNFNEKTGDVKVTGSDGYVKLTISWSDEKNTYPDNRKYSFDNTKNGEDIKIIKDGTEVKIAKNSESRFKNDNGQLVLAEAKDKDQIARENELTEIKEILKEVGLERLSIGDFVDGKRSQTSVEFKNAEELKKIQFKDLNGGSDYTSSFSDRKKITVYLDWEKDTRKFPKNMKFSFENNYFEFGGFKFMKNHKSVIIPQKTLKNPKNTEFKLEQQGKKWYLAKVTN